MSTATHSLFSGPIKGIVFDVDGVLIESRASNMAFYNNVRSALHLPPLTLEEENYCHMSSAQEALEHIIPQHLFEAGITAAKAIDYQQSILPLIVPHEGVRNALALLHGSAIPIGVFTNRGNTVSQLLAHFSLQDFFTTIKTAENCPPKPNPTGLLEILNEWQAAPHEIIFIGDSLVDQQAAEAAQVNFWAFGNSNLQAMQHLASYQDFLTLMQQYFAQFAHITKRS